MNFLLAIIAFNSNGSIFYNLRYFEQIYADKLKQNLQVATSSLLLEPIEHEIVNFYFIVTCHELAHNVEHDHNRNFANCLEDLAVQYMSKKERFLERFSLKN